MARRFNYRRVKIHRACQIIELADLLGAHEKTIGRWIAAGLRTADRRRPFLAHGAAFRSFMKARVGQAKTLVGGTSSAALSVFRFGTSYRAAVGVLAALNIPVHLVSPTKWKHHFGLDSHKEKSLALRLWPDRADLFCGNNDHGKAEAALLARYAADRILCEGER